MTDDTEDRLREQLTVLHGECWGWALACCQGRRDMAEEVLHMSYHKVLDQRARHDGRSSFKTWLFSVIRFTALDHQRWSLRRWLRFTGLENAPEMADEHRVGSSAMAHDERCAEVRAALLKLAARQAEVLRLVFYHDLTLDDAAAIMCITPGSVRQHYERGKTNLRRVLGDDSELS